MGGIRLHSVETLPDPGAIVWCKFPLRERPKEAGPWARPTLVLETTIHELAETGERFGSIWVSYGTDLEKVRGRPHLAITPLANAKTVGLHKPTGFCFDRGSVKHLTWCIEYFIAPDYFNNRAIVMGRLGDSERDKARELWRAKT